VKVTISKTKVFTLCLVISLLALSSSYADDPVTISPYKIILNAQNKGVAQDIQAVISKVMPSGYYIVDQSVTLQLGDSEIFNAVALRYCFIDSNFLASFDRKVIQNSEAVQSLAGLVVTATIGGQCTIKNSTGSKTTITFSGSALVEIINPEKKP